MRELGFLFRISVESSWYCKTIAARADKDSENNSAKAKQDTFLGSDFIFVSQINIRFLLLLFLLHFDCDPLRDRVPPQLHLLDHADDPAEGLWPEALLGVVALGHDLPALLGALRSETPNYFLAAKFWVEILHCCINSFFENFHGLFFLLQKMDNYFSTNCKRKNFFEHFPPQVLLVFFCQSSYQVPPDCEADLCLDWSWRGRRRDHLAAVGRLPVRGAAVATAGVESVAGARPGGKHYI